MHVEKKGVHIDSRTSRAMGRQGGGERAALQHPARVAVSVSKLVPPSPPRQEAALWAIASCDTLSRAPDYPGNFPTNNLRETCEAVKEAVEQANHCVSISSFLHPLGTAERGAVKMIGDACSKYFYILAMSLKLQPGGNLVRVAPSKVHGLGVFAARDIRKHICFTAYPIDLLALYEEGSEPGPRPLAVFSRQHRNSEAEAHKRLKKQLFDYGLDIAPGVTVYADPARHSPGFCGHMINDPLGTCVTANCVECPIGGGALIGILTLRDVREGEELLMNYGERYWQARGQTSVKARSIDCTGDV